MLFRSVEGVQFRLIQLPLTAQELSQTNAPFLRNQVAYKCFGYEAVRSFITAPFGSPLSEYGAVDDLPASRLNECDVPLALLYWTTSGGIGFVDLWSVRRRLTHPMMAGTLCAIVSGRRQSETEAMLWQFRDQIKDMSLPETALQAVVATQHFNYLPPAGVLPLSSERSDGIIINNFFSDVPHREPEFIDSALVRPLLREAINHEPIDLSKREMLWLYKVWQNERDYKDGGAARPYLVFASGYMPYLAAPRFDLAHWDYSNYARCEDCEV